MAKPTGPLPSTAALLSGAIKARPGRKAMGPPAKSPTGIKSAPGRPGLMPSKQLMGGLGL